MLEQFARVGLRLQCKNAFLARQINLSNVYFKSSRNASSENQNKGDDDLDKPYKYSTSPAAQWQARLSRSPNDDRHPQESNIISLSLAIFCIYFFILREENDIDAIFDRDLSYYRENYSTK